MEAVVWRSACFTTIAASPHPGTPMPFRLIAIVCSIFWFIVVFVITFFHTFMLFHARTFTWLRVVFPKCFRAYFSDSWRRLTWFVFLFCHCTSKVLFLAVLLTQVLFSFCLTLHFFTYLFFFFLLQHACLWKKVVDVPISTHVSLLPTKQLLRVSKIMWVCPQHLVYDFMLLPELYVAKSRDYCDRKCLWCVLLAYLLFRGHMACVF